MAFRSKRDSVNEVVDDNEDILGLRRLTDHPQLKDLFARKEKLAQKLAELVNSKRTADALRTEYERAHALQLAEGDPQALRRRDDLKGQGDKYQDEIDLIEAGLEALNSELDNALSECRQVAQVEIDAAFVEPLASAIAMIQGLIDANERLKVVENASARLLQTGKLHLYSEWLTPWLSRLQHKLNLVAPR